MTPDNVIQLPDLLERQAKRIVTALNKDTKIRTEWIDNQLEKADALAIARKQFPNNADFGKWCYDNGFGESVLSRDDRAALVEFGKDLAYARTVLERTNRTSPQHILRNEFSLRHVTKTIPQPIVPPSPQPKLPPMPPPQITASQPAPQPAPQPTPQPTPKPAAKTSQAAVLKQLDRAEAIRQGKTVQPLPLDTETVNSIHKQVRDLASTVPNLAGKARRSFEKTLTAEMTKLIAELNLHKERIDIEAATKIEQEVKRRLTLQLPEYEKRVTAAREREEYYGKLVNAVKVPLTQAEFETIRNILHPNAHPMATDDTKKKLNDAFIILNLKKLNLTGKK
jgi:hypothetical protein